MGLVVGQAGGRKGVTSVALTVPSIFSVAGSPITDTGTLAISLANQNANVVLAGPTSGGAAAPTFRSLVDADGSSLWLSLAPSLSTRNEIAPTADVVPLRLKGYNGGSQNLLEITVNSVNRFLLLSDGRFLVYTYDASSGSVSSTLQLIHNLTSGSGANGIGVGIAAYAQSSTTATTNLGRLRWYFNVATHASRESTLTLSVYNISTEVDVLTINKNGIQVSLSDATNSTIASFSSVSTYNGGSEKVGLSGLLYGLGASTSPTFIGLKGTVTSSASAYSADKYIGLYGYIYHQATSGTLNHARAVYASVQNVGAATIGLVAGLYIETPVNSGGGTLTAAYGVYIADQNVGTSKWAIRTNAGRVQFGDDVDIPSTKAYYFGDPTTDTSWRITRSGNDLVIQRRESGSWVTKSTIAA